ncbi:MAG: SDR family NAD(P)-dependent oxidoreductase, partial [Ignavibacteria bacterium]|nr:SDR family NAD(P)-dependent oxidoreductase [Ignavibacteria bacterium]
MDSVSLDGKNIWITGASRGIGKAIASGLIDKSANLILSASSVESFIDLKNELSAEQLERILFLPFDIAYVENIQNA